MSPSTLKRIEFMVLAVLADGDLHGYGIALEIEARSGRRHRVRPGSLYRVLDRLMRRGLLEPSDVSLEEGDDRRTYYRLTALGRQAVVDEARMLSDLARGVLVSGEGAETEPA